MNKPFQYIDDRTAYNLRYAYGYYDNKNKDTIQGCITKTADHYDQDVVTPVQFKNMIDRITQGASNSAITSRRCVNEVIQAICIYFPKHLKQTNVTSLLKCVQSTDMGAVEYIESTGYKFTNAQIQTLIRNGILMIDKMQSMTLPSFYALFSNNSFTAKINSGWDINPSIYTTDSEVAKKSRPKRGMTARKGQYKKEGQDENDDQAIQIITIYSQYTYLSKIVKKFDLKLDNQIWIHMMDIIGSISPWVIINLHRVLMALGAPLSRDFLEELFNNHTVAYTNLDSAIEQMDEVFSMYPDFRIDRAHIMKTMKCNDLKGNKLLLGSRFCSYDLMDDMYYWLDTGSSFVKSYLIQRITDLNDLDLMAHIVSLGYVDFGIARTFLNGNVEYVNSEAFTKRLLAFGVTDDFVKMYVDNKCIVGIDTLEYMLSKESIESLYKYATSYTDKGVEYMTRLMHEERYSIDDKVVVRPSNSYNSNHDLDDIYRVLKSMSERDRRIYSHLTYNDANALVRHSNILRYDTVITCEYLKYILTMGCENTIIKLLHITHKYDYLIAMIDSDMVLTCHNYLARLWMHNNIIIPRQSGDDVQSFCAYDGCSFIFSVDRNEKCDSDLGYDVIDRTNEAKQMYVERMREVQEIALDRIIAKQDNSMILPQPRLVKCAPKCVSKRKIY